jgi:hypothetical protein
VLIRLAYLLMIRLFGWLTLPVPNTSFPTREPRRVPHAGSIPNPKDAVEDALNTAVCDGRMTLRAAQLAIARNWVKAGAALGLSVPR